MTSTSQLVLFGYDRPSLEADFRDLLERHPIGGVLLHGEALGSPDQLRELTAELQSLAPRGLPLLIAVDQEGGPLQAWGPPHQPELPSAAEVGWNFEASGELLEVTLHAMNIGRQLASVGIQLDLAPVLDVRTPATHSILGDRCFGDRAELVATVGSAFVEGLQAAGVLACGKHFPGHGGAAVDPHHELPRVARDLEQLESVELLPFRAAISRGLEIVMTAHVLYPAWDADHPATWSSKILTELLRGELGFEGVVVADSMEMQALRDQRDLEEAAVAAVDAGCDMLLSVFEPERRQELLDGLERARRDGEITTDRFQQSLQRIVAVKQDWLVDP